MRLSHIGSLIPLALFILAACATSRPPPQSTPGAPAATAAVERFLQLASEKDYVQMGYVFGTEDGPIIRRDPPADVERRMYALASVLEHQQYRIESENPVPGRIGSAIRMEVNLAKNGQEYDVPFTAVRGSDGRWFIEQVGLEAITGN